MLDFIEWILPYLNNSGVISAELAFGGVLMIGGYKLHKGNPDPSDTLGTIFGIAGFAGMIFGCFLLLGVVVQFIF